ncbi:hypothetical protein SOP94_05905 [Peribacillus frigoritolerans]|uniref:hypothetical protein n=1 Tax=Peribacillus frigoritolerans TaxID=450367 RepID=UPI002B24684C|nr:hypothetical protein [Peribacillus frigoritolerans]MEB2627986.1 hypothetical protein [Peribacillus frigoritolerans]
MLNKVVWERLPGMELTDKYKTVNKLHYSRVYLQTGREAYALGFSFLYGEYFKMLLEFIPAITEKFKLVTLHHLSKPQYHAIYIRKRK